jgi:hypothetical protein
MEKIQMCSVKMGVPVLGLSAILFIISCSKSSSNPNTGITPPTTSGSSFVSVTDASPTSSMYGVYSDNTNIYPSGLNGADSLGVGVT